MTIKMHFKLIRLKLNPQPNVTSSYATVEYIRTFPPQQRNEHYCTRRLRQILLKQCTTMAHNNMRLCANASLAWQCRNDGDWIGHIDKLIIFGLKWTKCSSKKIHCERAKNSYSECALLHRRWMIANGIGPRHSTHCRIWLLFNIWLAWSLVLVDASERLTYKVDRNAADSAPSTWIWMDEGCWILSSLA